jgi:hypothetical protein
MFDDDFTTPTGPCHERSQRFTSGWKLAILVAAGLAFAMKLALAMNTYGSTDSLIWEAHLAKVKTEGVLAWYRDGVTLRGADGRLAAWIGANHPPVVASLIVAGDHLSHMMSWSLTV